MVRSVKDLLGDLTTNPRAQGVKRELTPEEEKKFRDAAPAPAKPKNATPWRTDPHAPIYVRPKDPVTTGPVEVTESEFADEHSICPDNDGKEHKWQISAGRKSCWLCGAAADPNKRSRTTTWQAQVYGTKVKK